MISTPGAPPWTGEIHLRLRGPDVLRWAEGEPHAAIDAADRRIDPLRTFERAASMGMLSGSSALPSAASARLTARSVIPAEAEESAVLRVENVAPGALRVLYHALSAQDLEVVDIGLSPADPLLGMPTGEELLALPFPEPHPSIPFRIVREQPSRRGRDRGLRITLCDPPGDSHLEEIYSACDVWCRLLLLGAYPPPGVPARRAGAMPDVAFLLDPFTIEQWFPDIFLCDEAAFSAILNHAFKLHLGGILVAQVEIL